MKTWRVWEELTTDENVWRAWRAFERGKRRRAEVADFAIDADRAVLRIARALRTGTWRHQRYRVLKISDPKRRIIAAATVADRVVHHAIHQVLAPKFDRRFVDHSYACLLNRGAHRALHTFIGRMRQYEQVLLLDIRRYFYSIDRARLRDLLVRAFPEPEVGALLTEVMESGADLYRRGEVVRWLDWDAPMAPGRGLPIGNLTSQWWGNVYLDGLDHHACRALRVPAWQRYMDDFSIFGESAAQLLEVREALADRLKRERGLELKDPQAKPRSTRGPVRYLGYRVSRAGFEVGDKARARLLLKLRSGVLDESGLVGSTAAWMFGS